MAYKATITVKVHGLPLEVDFAYAPAYRGERDCYGAPLTPDELEQERQRRRDHFNVLQQMPL